MARNQPDPGYAQPAFQLRVCPFCGASAHWKYDKKGRAYISCGFCQSKVFMYGHLALTGVQVLHEMIARSGVQRFRQVVQQRTMRRVHQVERLERRTGTNGGTPVGRRPSRASRR